MVDYTLANQSGAQFRAELNLILAALQGSAYGPSPPTTTAAGQLWVDASGTDPVLRIRNALDTGWIALGALTPTGFELAGSSAPGRTLIAAASIAAQRTALELGSGATAGLANQAQAQAGLDNATLMTPLRVAEAIAAQVSGATDLLADAMAATVAANTVVLKHCCGGSTTQTLSHSKSGNGSSYVTLLGETALTATRDCALHVAFDQARSGDTSTQFAAVLRNGVVLQEWSTSSTSWSARSVDVTLAAGDTIYLRLGATGSSSSGDTFTGTSLIRNPRYLVAERSLIGI